MGGHVSLNSGSHDVSPVDGWVVPISVHLQAVSALHHRLARASQKRRRETRNVILSKSCEPVPTKGRGSVDVRWTLELGGRGTRGTERRREFF